MRANRKLVLNLETLSRMERGRRGKVAGADGAEDENSVISGCVGTCVIWVCG